MEIRDVVKDFGEVRAVAHCSLAVGLGTITRLIGPNGAGKTSLFNLITELLRCSAGRIEFHGQRIDRLAPHAIFRKGIVRTLQIPRELRRMMVSENLMVVPAGQLGKDTDLARYVAERVVVRTKDVRRAI